MHKSSLDNVKPEQKPNSEPQPIVSTSPPAIGNTNVGSCPVRVQRKRTKGYKMPPNTKSVTRPGKFGNPYKIGMHNIFDIKDRTGKSLKDYLIEKNGENKYHTIEDCLLAYRQKINGSQAMQRVVKHYLKGKNLACFCPLDKPCHADILLEVANG